MQNEIESVMATWKRGAVVLLEAPGQEPAIRPAAFVYVIPGGLAWVEPSYADPNGAASNALHQRTGTVEIKAGLRLKRDGDVVTFLPYDPAEDRDLVGDALEWFHQHLQDTGTDWDAERKRVLDLLGSV